MQTDTHCCFANIQHHAGVVANQPIANVALPLTKGNVRNHPLVPAFGAASESKETIAADH
jgi:hypothetical protein